VVREAESYRKQITTTEVGSIKKEAPRMDGVDRISASRTGFCHPICDFLSAPRVSCPVSTCVIDQPEVLRSPWKDSWDQLCSEQLQRALGVRTRIHLHAQRHLPAQIVVGLRFRFPIRYPVMGLQRHGGRQQTRRHTRTPLVRTGELGKLLVTKELTPVASQLTVEGVLAHVPRYRWSAPNNQSGGDRLPSMGQS
jgi:hypothetical protein